MECQALGNVEKAKLECASLLARFLDKFRLVIRSFEFQKTAEASFWTPKNTLSTVPEGEHSKHSFSRGCSKSSI